MISIKTGIVQKASFPAMERKFTCITNCVLRDRSIRITSNQQTTCFMEGGTNALMMPIIKLNNVLNKTRKGK